MNAVYTILAMCAAGGMLAFGGVEAIGNMQKPEAGKAAVFEFGGADNHEFMLDGKPFQIRSGEMEPQRIPRSHWRHRIRAAKAMGLNTIAFYTFWNGLEQKVGEWGFNGMNDIAAFIDLCQEEGMWVLFRPGPFVCGEWDLGGLPSYLLKDDVTPLRYTGNKQFMEAQTRYLEKMAEIAIPRLAKNGGPILMIQLENEYGSYKTPHDELAYIQWLKDFWTGKGAGPFYLSEGTAAHHLRFIPEGVAIGLDPAENSSHMVTARAKAPNVPVFSSETYPGWLRHWGEGNWTSSPGTLQAVRWYMASGTSFNLFVLHGGTSFGLTAGANCNVQGGGFEPDLTSYDYGSPIGEHGNYTVEYPQYREIITKRLPKESAAVRIPDTPPCMEIPAFTPAKFPCRMLNLFSINAKKQTFGAKLPTFESLGQNQGMAMYEAKLPAGPAATLECTAHDYAIVYLTQEGKCERIGILDRRHGAHSLQIPERNGEAYLTIVLDTFGHINFNCNIEKDRKGLIGEVRLGGQPIPEWEVRFLPLQKAPVAKPTKLDLDGLGGGMFHATINLDTVQDTFLDMSRWQKGYVWVNGHCLGRYWNIGPQQRLYCPRDFLNEGENTIQVLDLFMTEPASIRGCNERNLDSDRHTENLNNDW